MKKKKKTEQRSVRNPVLAILATLVFVVIVVAGIYLTRNKPTPTFNSVGFNGPITWLGKAYVENLTFKKPTYYMDIVASKSPKKVNSEYSPVMILTYLNGELEWLGSGTTLHFAHDTNEYIFTAGHLFDSDTVGTNVFLYFDLYDPKGRCWGIDNIKHSSHIDGIKLDADDHREIDVALCRKGPITLVPGLSKAFKYKEQKSYGKFADLIEDIKLTSIVSGRTYNAIGWFNELKDETGMGVPIPYLTFDGLSRSGESGAGFVGSDKALYILLGSVPIKTVEGRWIRKPRIGVSRAIRIEFHW